MNPGNYAVARQADTILLFYICKKEPVILTLYDLRWAILILQEHHMADVRLFAEPVSLFYLYVESNVKKLSHKIGFYMQVLLYHN